MISEIQRQFSTYASHPFLVDVDGGRTYTYAEFESAAKSSAQRLAAMGIGRGDRVVVILPKGPELVAIYFACLFLGAASVPLPLDSKSTAISEAFRTTRAGAAILAAEVRASGPWNGTVAEWRIGSSDEAPFTMSSADDFKPFNSCDGTELFNILFTSGTTGKPKAVASRVDAQFGNVQAFNRHMGFGPDSRFLHVWPMTYSLGILNIVLGAFMAGGSVILTRAFDARSALNFWAPAVAHEANMLWMGPTMLAMLMKVDRGEEGVAYCRNVQPTICVGTAPLPRQLKLDFEARYGVELYESYGLSELLLVTGASPAFPRVPESCGRIVSGVDIQIFDAAGGRVGPDVDGEIAIDTPWAMAGYIDPEDGQPVAPDLPMRTGDIGRVDASGNLFISGRIKDLIIRGGQNISPRMIEEVLLQEAGVSGAAVVGIPHSVLGEDVLAVLTLAADADPDATLVRVRQWCEQNLTARDMPSRFEVIENLPLGTTGKVDKSALRALFSAAEGRS